jgi:hypothetical protein
MEQYSNIRKFAFSKVKIVAHFPWNPSKHVQGSLLLWRFFYENACWPRILLLLISRSHKTTTCRFWIFHIFFDFFLLIQMLVKPHKTPLTASKPRQKPRWAFPNLIARLWPFDQTLSPNECRWIMSSRRTSTRRWLRDTDRWGQRYVGQHVIDTKSAKVS